MPWLATVAGKEWVVFEGERVCVERRGGRRAREVRCDTNSGTGGKGK
jgi:hypothetical protein